MTNRRWTPRRLGLALSGFALLLVAVVALWVVLRSRDALGDLSAQLEQLENADRPSETLFEWADEEAFAVVAGLRGISLPDAVEAVLLARQGEVRPYYWLRASLPQVALDELIASTCLGELREGYVPEFAYGADEDIVANLTWWEPDAVAQPAGADCTDETGVAFRLLADVAAPAVRVYLEIAPGQR